MIQNNILPDWKDGEYHDYKMVTQLLNKYAEDYPDLVEVFSIGKSVKNKDIWCIKITNKKSSMKKYSCLIDGCIHGAEWETADMCIYLNEYLLINNGKNEAVTNILNNTEIYIVPIVNPDGRTNNKQSNDNGIDINRNFDVDFGNLAGRSLKIGNKIKISKITAPIVGPFLNCGKKPFSEPETRALRDLMKKLMQRNFSFYVNCHTPAHCLITPWFVCNPPFEISQKEKDLFTYVTNWVVKNTEYELYTGKGLYSIGKDYVSGTAMDWCYKEFRIPSFIFEILWRSNNYRGVKFEHAHLVHWMKSALPVFLFLLFNTENLCNWKIPTLEPKLPENIPPKQIY